jgi:hypothetical protein
MMWRSGRIQSLMSRLGEASIGTAVAAASPHYGGVENRSWTDGYRCIQFDDFIRKFT